MVAGGQRMAQKNQYPISKGIILQKPSYFKEDFFMRIETIKIDGKTMYRFTINIRGVKRAFLSNTQEDGQLKALELLKAA